jgi:hypothetical protein
VMRHIKRIDVTVCCPADIRRTIRLIGFAARLSGEEETTDPMSGNRHNG